LVPILTFSSSATSCSLLLLISWVEEGWISEFTVVIFSVEAGNNCSSLRDEVVDVNLVGVIRVHVVLEVLNHVHTGLDALVSSNSWEGERFVKEFPGVDLWCLDTEFFGDLNGIEVVLLVELSGELVHLPVHLVLGDPESCFASTG